MTEFLGRVEQLAQHNGQHLCLIMDTKDFLKQLRDLRMGGWWRQMGEETRTNRAAWINAATIAPRPRPSPSPLTLRCQQSDGDEARQK
ncbi:hypothetical protein NHJ6243_008892 [Beauveria neobassiana]